MVHVLVASFDYSIGDEGVNTLAIWILVVRPWGSIIHWPSRYECSFFPLALICQISSIYPYPELFGKSDEKCIPDDHLPPQNLDLHHHNRQKINISQSHWMDVTLFFVGLSNKSVIKPVRGSSYSFEP
jgi:hypothetical protein